jgi:hypothetical protein
MAYRQSQIISDGNDIILGHSDYVRDSETIPYNRAVIREVKVCQMSDFCFGIG